MHARIFHVDSFLKPAYDRSPMLEIWLQYFPGKASLYSYGRFFLSCSKTLLSLGEFEWAQARNRTWSAYTSLNQKGLHNPFGPESQTGEVAEGNDLIVVQCKSDFATLFYIR